MQVWTYPEKKYEELGAVRWQVSWEQLTAKAAARLKGERPDSEGEDFDYDADLWHPCKAFKTEDAARTFARKIVAEGTTFFGAATVVKQTVDWYVEEDRVASWEDCGSPEEVSA